MASTLTRPFTFPEDVTITDLLLQWNPYNMSAAKPAIIDGVTGQIAYTHASFRTSVKKLAVYLRRTFQVRQDRTVCVLLRNNVRDRDFQYATNVDL